MIKFTDFEKQKFKQWVIESISDCDYDIVPRGEGFTEGLIYNLVHLIEGDGKVYNYESEQDDEIKSWGIE